MSGKRKDANEFGIKLDVNGYAPSLLPTTGCFFCGQLETARHEVFNASNRQKSKEYGLWLKLCPSHHRDVHNQNLMSIRRSISMDRYLKETMQETAMKHYGWSSDEFRKRFGKNYL